MWHDSFTRNFYRYDVFFVGIRNRIDALLVESSTHMQQCAFHACLRLNESFQISMRHVTYEWVRPHVNPLFFFFAWIDLRSCSWNLRHGCSSTQSILARSVTWPIYMCDTTYSYVWYDSLICVTWLIRMWDTTPWCMWHGPFVRVVGLIHMRHMTHSYVWRDSFICVTWRTLMCDMTHL